MARPLEAARSDPAHIAEAGLRIDVLPAFDCISGERPAVFRAEFRDLAPRVHERDPAFDPRRLANPSDHGRPESGPDRARHPRLGVIVFAAHPDAVLPVTVGHRVLSSVLTRLDTGDEDFPDRFPPGVPDLEPIVLENLVQPCHPAVDPVDVPLRLQRPKHKHRTQIFRPSILDRNILPPVATRPPVALLFENVHRLANPRSAGPDTPATDCPPDCRLVHPDARRRQRVLRSGQRGTDPLDAPRPEQRADLHAREFRPGFQEPGEQEKPGPVPCHLATMRFAQRSSPALTRPHRAASSAIPKSERQIYWLSTT